MDQRIDDGGMVARTFKMKIFYITLFLAPIFLFSEWIHPPMNTESGYPVPRPDVVPEMPRAHGAHPGYSIEWWYWVGHLETLDGREEFGFQSTVFRLEEKQARCKVTRDRFWATNRCIWRTRRFPN